MIRDECSCCFRDTGYIPERVWCACCLYEKNLEELAEKYWEEEEKRQKFEDEYGQEFPRQP